MADIVQLVENGQKKYIKTHVKAIEELEKELAKYEKTDGLSAGETLWAGGLVFNSTNTITPTKSLDECKHGWELTWLKWDSTNGADQGSRCRTYIPKTTPRNQAALFPIALNQIYREGAMNITKNTWFSTTELKGHGQNALAPNDRAILQSVVSY